MRDWHQESIELFQRFWHEQFGKRGVLEMFSFFSISLFQKTVSSIEDAQNFSKRYQEMLENYYCESAAFTATYPEDEGALFTTEAVGHSADFQKQCRFFKRCLWRKFMGNNPKTHTPWKTDEVLLKLLASSDEDVQWECVKIFHDLLSRASP